jgi:uncharacterized protein YbjT (DUF2867 family)
VSLSSTDCFFSCERRLRSRSICDSQFSGWIHFDFKNWKVSQKKTVSQMRRLSSLSEHRKQEQAKVLAAKKEGGNNMKIVVIGGTGLIGSKLVTKLNAVGHEAVAASPNSGVNTLTGEGLAEVLKSAQVVVDVSNSPSFEDVAVMNFFQTSTRNLLSYEAAAGVGHHVALSIVGSERLPQSGYLRAKVVQEKLIKEGSIPYSIIHSTQFFEFVKRIADEATTGNSVHLPPVLFQPIASDDVVSALFEVATSSPLNGAIEIAGPDVFRFDELIRQRLRALNDSREVVADPQARYFGAELSERSIVPGDDAQLGETRFEDWLSRSTSEVPPTPQRATAASIQSGPQGK